MLVAAVLVPDTALLVPGVAGRADVAVDLRAAVLDALRGALDSAPGAEVVVVAPADERRVPADERRAPADRHEPVELAGSVTASLAAAGVPDALLITVPVVELAAPRTGPERRGARLVERPPSVASAVALHLLVAAGRTCAVRVVEVPRAPRDTDDTAGTWTELGRDLVAGDEEVVLVVVGSGSARHGPDAPLAEDPDAAAADHAMVGAFEQPDPAALAVLAETLTARDATRLAVSGWAPWHVLAGAVAAGPVTSGAAPDARSAVTADVTAPVLLGAQHVVGTWRVSA
ncbi:hypothetical protein KIN34_16075 [Cellulomonas sp. DKR-3]|uniref:Extradiol ring-cleavage dioxygenase class III enzyme subunit B domain-containing protein n=1 Tax=Cellulomonas fulva TaxID=2835530 RepID=A0ABS5U365_9CELL|nr:hypothetical protein [Cellulomonas fulva]MBT0995797.1 hypothetical protein [Cellulomonas fulva]